VASYNSRKPLVGSLECQVNQWLRYACGVFPGPAGSLPRLFAATNSERRFDIALEIAGARAGARLPGDLPAGKVSST